MNNNFSLSAGVIALLAVVFHVSNPPGIENRGVDQPHAATAGKTAVRREAGGTPEGFEGPWLATRAFFHPENAILDPQLNSQPVDLTKTGEITACGKQEQCRQTLRNYFGIKDGYVDEFLIAAVPDPLHTRLELLTDSTLEALQKAAEDAGWEFATQWLPWYDRQDVDETEPSRRRQGRREIREQEKQPGLLVFRRAKLKGSGFDKRVLFIFLVSETPTAGINGYEFKMARAYVMAFDHPRATLIQGPNFSGSLFSLAELINDDRQEYDIQPYAGTAYYVRTGTATNNDYARAFKNETGADFFSTSENDFFSTSENKVDQQLHFCELLDDLHIRGSEAALLLEDETGFAHGVQEQATHERDGQPGPRLRGPCLREKVRVLTFPREISHLRNAYREAVEQSHAGKNPAPDVIFSLKDPDSGEDSVPIFSKAQSPLSQNAALNEVMSEIRRDRLRIVEIGATNVLDLLFVASVLRRQCPDTRLVVPFPDLLFVQAAQSEPLTGTLALSSYPLFFARKRWMGDKTGVTHSDVGSEGVYNATLLLLARSAHGVQAQPDREIGEKVDDYFWNDLPHAPAWLMTLDRSGFSPVKVMAGGQTGWFENDARSRKPDLRLPTPARTATLLMSVLALISLFFSGWIGYMEYDPYIRWFRPMAIESAYTADSPRVFCLLASLLLLAAMQAILYIPLRFHEVETVHRGVELFALAGIIAPLCLVAKIVWTRLWPRSPSLVNRKSLFKTPRDFWMRRLTVTLALSLFCGSLLVWTDCCYWRGNRSFFFSYRSLELQTGSSPAITLLAALLALWVFALVHLNRFYLAANQRPRVGTSTFDIPLRGCLGNSRRNFNRWMVFPLNFRWASQVKWGIALALIMLLACGMFRVHVNLSSIDGRPFDLLSNSLQILVIVAVVLTCTQIRICWSLLQTFLTSLNRLPLASAFTRLTYDSRGGPIWVRRLNLQSLDIPIRSGTVLHDIRVLPLRQPEVGEIQIREVQEWRDRYVPAVQRLLAERMIKKAENGRMRAVPKTRDEARRDFCQLRYVSASLADEISDQVLMPEYRRRTLVTTIATLETGPNERNLDTNRNGDANTGPDVLHLAQTFVALQFSTFAMYAVRQIQNLLWFLSIGFVLLLISLNAYHFQAPQTIGRFLIVMFLVLGYITWTCLAQMERDPILSRISGSKEGELNKEFYLRIFAYGALPVLGILASEFPSISNFLFSWVQPTLQAMH